ncbi:hypothetical protein Pint_10051 [Pistacia integerrima]|uniref:Uncharacterized protein n=1 Tax=Pistacia integerrima TaxID=434235 RepID=A0ACC0XM36_9ROSI|nr:hypothetical protein Pint_10051 [Pistacia integerrima]
MGWGLKNGLLKRIKKEQKSNWVGFYERLLKQMADAFVQILLENLNSLIRKEVGLLWGVDKDMKKLSACSQLFKAVFGRCRGEGSARQGA